MTVRQLGDFITLQRGTSYKGGLVGLPGPALIGLGVIERNGGFRTKNTRTYGGDCPESIAVKAGDLFVSLKDVTHTADLLGAVAKVPPHVKIGRLTQDTIRLDFRVSDVSRDYTYWLLRSPEYRAYCRLRGTGTTNLDLSRNDFLTFGWDFPSLPKQRAVAAILDAIDEKIGANVATAQVASSLADHVFMIATNDASLVPIGSLLTPLLGGTPSRARASHWVAEVPWVSARDVAGAPHGLVIDSLEKISREAAKTTRAHAAPAGSVIITARGTVGAVARLGVEASFNQSCYAFVPGALPPSVLFYTVRTAAQNALSLSHGSVFSTITVRSFDFLNVPMLSPERIQSTEEKLEPLLRVVTARVKESRILAELRDTLLPHLMSGRITVREAEKTVEDVL